MPGRVKTEQIMWADTYKTLAEELGITIQYMPSITPLLEVFKYR